VEVHLPVNEARKAEAFSWPMQSPGSMQKLGEASKLSNLQPGRRYRVELAFIDRRLSLAVEGQLWLSVDLPSPGSREGVARPFQVHADGVRANLHHFCLYRDVHYGQQGKNGVRGKSVQLGVDQYFVLGDNSPNSQDSRFWPEEGRIPRRCLVGSAWLVYGSSPLRRLP
jgi:signal peptidase I